MSIYQYIIENYNSFSKWRKFWLNLRFRKDYEWKLIKKIIDNGR